MPTFPEALAERLPLDVSEVGAAGVVGAGAVDPSACCCSCSIFKHFPSRTLQQQQPPAKPKQTPVAQQQQISGKKRARGSKPAVSEPSWQQVKLEDVAFLSQPIGSQVANTHIKQVKLPANATAKQRAEYELCHVKQPVTEQMVHKAKAASIIMKHTVDTKQDPGLWAF